MKRRQEEPLSEEVKQSLSGDWSTIDSYALGQWKVWLSETCGYIRADTIEKMFAQMRIGAVKYRRLRKEVDELVALKLEALAKQARKGSSVVVMEEMK